MGIKWTDTIFYLAAVLVAACGTYTDLKYHKIYNKLVLPPVFAGLGCHLLFGGLWGFLDSLAGLLTGILCAILWIFPMLKAGDVKLYMAIGALAGAKFAGYTVIFSILIGGVVASVLMVSRKSGRTSLKRLREYFLHMLYTKQFHKYPAEEHSGYFSFGGCILAGTLVTIWYLETVI